MSTDPHLTPDAAAPSGPATLTPVTQPETGSTAAPQADSAAESVPGDVSPQDAAAAATPPAAPTAAPAENESTEHATRRRLRLNPTVDPQVVRPIPNLAAGESVVPPGLDGAPGATPPAATPTPAAAGQAAPAAAAVPAPSVEPPRPRLAPVAIPRSEELDAAMESEIAAAISAGQLEAPAVAAPAEEGAPPVTLETVAAGAKLKGTIQSVTADSVFLDLGLPMSGAVPLRQFDPKQPPQVGDRVNVTVDKVDETEGLIHCHLPRGRGRVSGDWNSVVVGQTVECNVVGTNKGGLEVTVGSLRGFLPASQVELGYAANLEHYVGQKLLVRVTEVNPARRRLIVSRRLLLAEEREASAATALDEIQPGQVRTGVVKSLKDFGAFIDLGGIDGFLHVGQISWQRINKPSDVLTEGQQVEVKVLSVDREKKRISLSLRQTEQNPWATAEEKYAKGTQVTGRVSRIEPFGAFIELEPGVEGLVHISELDHKRVRAVSDVLSLNQMVELQVLELDPKKKRISLSLKALKAKPEEAPREAPAATPTEAPPPRKPKGNLKGGIGGTTKGGLFGDPRQYS